MKKLKKLDWREIFARAGDRGGEKGG